MNGDDDFQKKLQDLNALFAAKLGERFTTIDSVMQRCLDDVSARPSVDESVDELHRLLHSLAGSAGTFGFEALGQGARKIEYQVVALKEAGAWTREDLQPVANAIAALKCLLPAPSEPN